MLKRNLSFKNVLFFLLILFLVLRPVVDPDLGWHIGIGRYIIENRTIPQEDIFSFSQPDYPYAYLYWLTELFIYLFYYFFGLWGVTFFYATIAAFGFWFLFKLIERRTKTGKIKYFLYFLIPLSIWVIGLRTQVVTFLGLTLLYYLFDDHQLRFKDIYWLVPLIFLIWANMHGGFILGLAFLALLIAFKLKDVFKSNISPEKKQSYSLKSVLLLCLSAVTVLINPYGLRMYKQALQIASNRFNAQFNLDWQPLITHEPHTFLFAFLLFCVVAFILLSGKGISWKEKILTLFFFLLSLKSKRFVLPLLVVLLPAFLSSLNSFINSGGKIFKTNKFPLYVALFSVALIFMGESAGKLLLMSQAYRSKEIYSTRLSQELKYPYQAVVYMKENGVPKRLLNEFYWGGYLIWNLPGHKFFIDGRMDTFIVEGESFAKTYRQIVNLEPGWQEFMEEYEIDSVLAPKDPKRRWLLTEYLKTQSNWKTAHEDEVSLYLIRVN